MQVRKRRTEVTIETQTVIAVSLTETGAAVAVCPQCAAERVMLTPLAAARLLQTTVREVCRLAEAGGVHSVDARDGQLLVCASSLPAGGVSGGRWGS